MAKGISITIQNKLTLEKRDMTVYHHASRSAHMISHNSSVTLTLEPDIEEDYLHVSIVSGPGHLQGHCFITLPLWIDFELTAASDAAISHSNNRTVLKIPPGPPVWQLKMTQSFNKSNNRGPGSVTIGDGRARKDLASII
jgi:hypothetical protein